MRDSKSMKTPFGSGDQHFHFFLSVRRSVHREIKRFIGHVKNYLKIGNAVLCAKAGFGVSSITERLWFWDKVLETLSSILHTI